MHTFVQEYTTHTHHVDALRVVRGDPDGFVLVLVHADHFARHRVMKNKSLFRVSRCVVRGFHVCSILLCIRLCKHYLNRRRIRKSLLRYGLRFWLGFLPRIVDFLSAVGALPASFPVEPRAAVLPTKSGPLPSLRKETPAHDTLCFFWHIGILPDSTCVYKAGLSVYDAYFIIDRPPNPSNDDVVDIPDVTLLAGPMNKSYSFSLSRFAFNDSAQATMESKNISEAKSDLASENPLQ